KTAYIKGDINGLIQVIDNIIQNAIYSYNGNPNEKIDLTITKEGNMIQFKIQDYGVGISNQVKDKLFKEMITTRGKNGTGLGLYMSYSMIKGNFKGDMYFESEEGKGTTFYIKVPISE
ncbi:MAG: HAMP domain-containing sensor histidine kinase, partial [Clostridia bacterium]|nr:HAMP domain-containing sensor histidine kinase [Clostridia bacterium]